MRFIFILLLLTSCHDKSDTTIEKEKIIGMWYLIGDQQGQTVFTKTEELDYNYGQLMASYVYQIDNHNTLTLKDKSDGEIYNWRITKLTNDSLIINYIKRNYDRVYVRKKPPTSN